MSEQATAPRPRGSTDPSAAIKSVKYEDLYRRWEEGNWKATGIDLSKDKEGWRSLTEIQRRSALWTY